MALATIVVLLFACAWLGARLLDANKDNAALRKRVENLKRQMLVRR